MPRTVPGSQILELNYPPTEAYLEQMQRFHGIIGLKMQELSLLERITSSRFDRESNPPPKKKLESDN